jgi:hypothetical protein
VDYAQTLLAQYTVTYDRRRRRLRTVKKPVLYATSYASAQVELFTGSLPGAPFPR